MKDDHTAAPSSLIFRPPVRLANLGHRGDVTAARRGSQRVARHAHVGDLHGESVRFDGGLEFLQEAARFGRPARDDDRHRAFDFRQLARILELFAQFIDHRIDHFLVINVQGAGDLVFRRARKVERLFLDQPDASERFVNDGGDAQINVIAGHRQAESEHRDRQESDTDIAHSAATTDADAGEVLVLQLGEDYGEAFVDRLGFVSERMHEILDHRLVVDQVGFGAVAPARDAEAEQLVLAPARDYRLDDRLNDLLAHRLLRIHHAVLHRAPGFGAEEAGETFGVVSEYVKVF